MFGFKIRMLNVFKKQMFCTNSLMDWFYGSDPLDSDILLYILSVVQCLFGLLLACIN